MKKVILMCVFIFVGSNSLLADSPLTSTAIHEGYLDEEIVLDALFQSELTDNLLMYLESPENPITIKIALINALSWDIDGKNNSNVFFQYLNREKKYKDIEDFTQKANGDLIICLAYLKALDDYFDVTEAIEIANKAKNKIPKSYTVNIVCALIEAQKALVDNDWCKVYQLTNRVRKDKTLIDDMNDSAKKEIFEYMDIYEEYCDNK